MLPYLPKPSRSSCHSRIVIADTRAKPNAGKLGPEGLGAKWVVYSLFFCRFGIQYCVWLVRRGWVWDAFRM
jgi:hypothetical protein